MNDQAELDIPGMDELVSSVGRALAPPWSAFFCLFMVKAAYRAGDLAAMERRLAERFADSSKTAEQMAEFDKILVYMEEMKDFERRNGSGSCLQLENRATRTRIERGLYSAETLENARKSSWKAEPC